MNMMPDSDQHIIIQQNYKPIALLGIKIIQCEMQRKYVSPLPQCGHRGGPRVWGLQSTFLTVQFVLFMKGHRFIIREKPRGTKKPTIIVS